MNKANRGEYGDDSDGLKDFHHLLWCRRPWNHGYAHQLRDHIYMGILIPRKTLHRPLHQHMQCIPVPADYLCLDAITRLDAAVRYHDIDVKHDPPSLRLQFLIELWEDRADATVKALKKEQRFFRNYEQKHDRPTVQEPTLFFIPALLPPEPNPLPALAAV